MIEADDRYELERLARPLIELLNGPRFNPHMTLILTPTGYELVEGVAAKQIHDYVKD